MTIHKLKNITYDLVKMEKALVFQILEQDESTIVTSSYASRIRIEIKDFIICSEKDRNPSIRGCHKISLGGVMDLKPILYLRSDIGEKRNLLVSSCLYNSNTHRDKYYTIINQALKEWDEYVEQLKEEK